MVRASRWASLNLVKAEVDQTLTTVQSVLEIYLEEGGDEQCHQAMEGLAQVWGAMQLVGLTYADTLVDLCKQLLLAIDQLAADQDKSQLADALGQGLMVLGCYLEYVQIKDQAWPQLLIPAINKSLVALRRPLLPDGDFLANENLVAGLAGERVKIAATERARRLKRAHQVYQLGLLGVLRESDDPGHSHMMLMAMQKAVQLCELPGTADLLMVILAAIQALGGGVAMTQARKQWLARLERMLCALVQGKQPSPASWLSSSLYLVALGVEGTWVEQVQRAYHLRERCLNQEQLTEEYELMCGPGSSVLRTVSSVLAEETAQIKDALDLLSRGVSPMGETEPLDRQIRRLSQTLVMLGQLEVSQQAARWADRVIAWTGEPSETELNGLVDMLLSVENAMTLLLKDVSPKSETPIINSKISLHQLDEARAMLVSESRSGLSLAKRAVTSFLEAHYDRMHLANVPSTLNSVAGGLSFLNLERGAQILKQVAAYIEIRLLQTDQDPSMSDMELLADAVSSVDYYLESMETFKPMGDSVLLLAENSVAELGFPVLQPVAA